MEDRIFRIVEVDGILADIRPLFNEIATSVLDRPVEVREDLEPPHTVKRLSTAAGLTVDEQVTVRATIREIKDFWVSVPATSPWRPVPLARAIFHARRLQPRGRSVLLQTIEWLAKAGYKYPIVWIEED